MLPSKHPEHISPVQLFYIPYFRFKGTIFYVRENEVGHKLIDTTRLGIDEEKLPVSLGLRPQAMKLLPVVSTMEGAFIQQTVPTKTAFSHAAMVTELFSGKSDKAIYHRAFIGETLSRIYQPCYTHDGIIYDAVVNKPLGAEKWLDGHRAQSCSSKSSWEPQFISTICPECSGLLDGESDSLVLHCRNCKSLWQENAKKFKPLSWKVVESEDRSAQYLPFWQITFSTMGVALQSFGDYLRFTNQPVVVDTRFDALPLAFWIPAFKLNPKAFLQVASQLTISQRRIPAGDGRRPVNDHPVTLGQGEAVQAIKSVLAATTLSKSKKLPLLAQMTVVSTQCALIYLPFIKHPNDSIQEHTRATILGAALRFGRKL
jgi:hypothetical protein